MYLNRHDNYENKKIAEMLEIKSEQIHQDHMVEKLTKKVNQLLKSYANGQAGDLNEITSQIQQLEDEVNNLN